jgi:hypothetical protein
MTEAKVLRTRSRGRRQVKVSKRRTRTRKVRIPRQLHAPITADIEGDLKTLVARFGEKKVLEALDPLVTKCKWNDWQCVANAIRRIAREK